MCIILRICCVGRTEGLLYMYSTGEGDSTNVRVFLAQDMLHRIE